jgi:hypothetical protein
MRLFGFPWLTMFRGIAGGMFVLGAVAWGIVEHSQATIAADDAIKPVSTAIPSAALPFAGSSATAKPGKAAKPTQGFTPEREAAALTFVRMHHAELAELLERLKTRRPQEYQKAIRELFRASERLASSQEQQPLRYELELQEWKLSSRIQLLVARMSMNRTPELEQELRQLLNEQVSVHRDLIRFSYERTSARAAALQKELKDLEQRQPTWWKNGSGGIEIEYRIWKQPRKRRRAEQANRTSLIRRTRPEPCGQAALAAAIAQLHR